VNRMQAFAWNCGNQALDAKEEAQAITIARRDTDAKVWGGARAVQRSLLKIMESIAPRPPSAAA
jgi:hypothetical protein